MKNRRPGLWAEVALTLALTTLVAVTLNGGLLWLVAGQARVDAGVGLAQQLAETLASAIEVRAEQEPMELAAKHVLDEYEAGAQPLDGLFVVGKRSQLLASKLGNPPKVPDAGLRAALFARESHVDVTDRLSTKGLRVVATAPIPTKGPAKAAIRVSMRAGSSASQVGRVGFLVGYGLFTALIIGGVGYVLFRGRVVSPIQAIQGGTSRIAAGEFEHRLEVEGPRELEVLTDALNEMAHDLEGYRERTERQVEHLEAANQALKQAQSDLVRSAQLASVGRLAAGIAHEVGNPLAAVMGYLDLLAEDEGVSAEQRDLLLRTSREVSRINGILRELLDYARPSAGHMEAVRIGPVVQGALELVRHQPAFKDLHVSVEVPDGLPIVQAEPEKLHQVFVNLLLNAADAMHGEGALWISASEIDEGVSICVRDSGSGLPDVSTAQLFEPFYTTKGAGEGTGLGLAISLAIIDGIGGKLQAADHAEGGASFTVWLPSGPEAQ